MSHPLLALDGHPVFAHRGASGTLPENTLAAFDRALAEGADGLEFDVRLSRDGVPVVIHDPTLERTTTGAGAVRSAAARELHRLGVPALEEVVGRFPGVPLLIELKVAEAVPPVLALLGRRAPKDQVMLASFLERALVPCRAAGYRTSASRRGILALAARAALRLPPPRGRDNAYSVPARYRNRVPVPTRRFIAAARRLARPVHVWTVDDPAQANRLWDLGASGMITNFPARIVTERNRRFGTPAGPAPGQ